MGRAPAYIFVIRHGSRLDQSNKQWHYTSPTPYDSPLTYSGWAQAKAVGRRVGDILRDREVKDDAAAAEQGVPRKRRKFDVVIHSSPFLRCIQTSVGISAGLAEQPALGQGLVSPTSPRAPDSLASSGVLDPDGDKSTSDADVEVHMNDQALHRCVLRLDSFLGEWLTPGYFETISPPPASAFMLAGAKAELLRREDYNNYAHLRTFPQSSRRSVDETASPVPISTHSATNSSHRLELWGLNDVSGLAGALQRSNSISNVSDTSFGESSYSGGYVAPMPLYAVAHTAEIPKGLVAHARDHCCDIDYQWDTSRGPLDLGDGGQLPEEWPEMHKRFRKGMQKLMDWYCTANEPTKMVTKGRRPSSISPQGSMMPMSDGIDDADDDVEREAVLIIVTHGAGCNALVGAITQQPALTDIALASITEAVRKADKDGEVELVANGTTDGHDSQLAMNEYYDMRSVGATDHLRRTANRPSRSPSGAQRVRGRNADAIPSSPLSGIDGSVSRSSSAAANLGSARRDSGASSSMPYRVGIVTNGVGMTVGGGGYASAVARQRDGSGVEPRLWSPLRQRAESIDDQDGGEEEEEEDFLTRFSSTDKAGSISSLPENSGDVLQESISDGNGTRPTRSATDAATPRTVVPPELPKPSPAKKNLTLDTATPPTRLGSGQGGLWGSPRSEGTGNARELRNAATMASKRRWTVNQRP